jgi:uncharacterized protein
MQLDLTRFRQPQSAFAHEFQPEDLTDREDAYRVISPVELRFDVHKDKARFRLVGSVRTDLELVCSRCLEAFTLPVSASFDSRYLPASEVSAEAEREMEDDDLGVSYYQDEVINLNELLREQFYLALPMKPLCQESCRGLCPQCGTNLNQATCGCAQIWEDPRLAPLKALKDRKV